MNDSDLISFRFSRFPKPTIPINYRFPFNALLLFSILFFFSCDKDSDKVEVVAIFTTSGSETGTEEIVQFSDRSTGEPTSWSWTFEGGTPATSTDPNPTVTYAFKGVYDVTLTVSNSFSENTLERKDLITVKKIIYPAFSADGATIPEGESIQFTDETTGDPNSWFWTFEGGTPATSFEQHPTVTYNQAGMYKVILTVSNGSTDGMLTKERMIHVTCIGTYCETAFTSYSKSEEIIYGNNADGHQMILYTPEGDNRTDRPVIALMGGGSNFGGTNLDLLEPVAIDLVRYGAVVALLRYRVVNTEPAAKMIYAQQDCRTAVRYLKSEAENLRINPDHIFIGGNGNGAFAALFHAYVDENEFSAEEIAELNSLGGIEGEDQGHGEFSSEVAGVVSLAGGMYESLEYITAEDVPIYAVHGTDDPDVDPDLTPGNPISTFGSIRIVEKAKSEGLPARLYLIQGGVHETPRQQSSKWDQDLFYFIREVIQP